jgi:hypothetical protein
MKRDAFDDVHCPFNYTAELQKAREALNAKVGTHISENPMAGYRELSKQFGISPATLCAIAKKFSRNRKPGRRSRGRRIAFDVRHQIGGKELITRVTVMSEDTRDSSVSLIRGLVATYYSTNDVAKAGKHKAVQNAQYTVRELERLVYSPSAVKERAKPNLP